MTGRPSVLTLIAFGPGPLAAAPAWAVSGQLALAGLRLSALIGVGSGQARCLCAGLPLPEEAAGACGTACAYREARGPSPLPLPELTCLRYQVSPARLHRA